MRHIAPLFLFAGLLCLVAPGCEEAAASKPKPKSASASDVKKLPGEADLTVVSIKKEAIDRLGIQSARITEKKVERTRVLGGDIVVAPGHSVIVSSPINGTLRASKDGTPEPGSSVETNQLIFELVPLLSPEAQTTLATTLTEAQGQVDQAEQQLAQATLVYERAERLRKQNLGGAGAVDDAKAKLDIATATLGAAKARRDKFEKTLAGIEGGSIEPLRIEAESNGVLKNLLASPGQKVAAGAPLLEVMSLNPILVRVPVYVGDLERIDTERPVRVGNLTDVPGTEARLATPVPAPPTADPLGSTADLYYQVENADLKLRPGQRVGVTLFLREPQTALTVPQAAVLRDFEGGCWVYTVSEPGKYVRRRVGVASVVGDDAVLAFGPPAGTEVVTTGAAELFGVEFGGNK